MEKQNKASKSEEFRRAQADFYKYSPVEDYIAPSTEADLTRIQISKSFMPSSEVPGNDR